MRAVTHLVLHAGTDQLKAFQNLVLPVIGLVERLLAAGEEEKVFRTMALIFVFGVPQLCVSMALPILTYCYLVHLT